MKTVFTNPPAMVVICLLSVLTDAGAALVLPPTGPTNDTSGLVFWLTLDEGTGSATADISGNNYTATLYNSASWTTGIISNAVICNANTSDYVGVNGPAVPMNSLSSATLCGWVKMTGGFALGFNDNTGSRFGIEGGGGRIYWYAEQAGASYPSCAYASDGNWHWLVLSYNGSATGSSIITAYIDGAAQPLTAGGYSSSATLAPNLGSFTVARSLANSAYYSMSCDDVRLYNRALSLSEITNQFQWPVGGRKLLGATRYYIDYASGSDANSGLSTNTPWQHQPYMTGWTGMYNHFPGDQFVFKGGVVWPSNCFPLTIKTGGGPSGSDYYGVDSNWFAGGNFTRPVFDGGHKVNTLVGVNNASYIDINSIELRAITCGVDNQGLIAFWEASYLTGTNLWLHDWLSSGTGPGSDTAHGGWIGANANTGWGFTNIILANSEIDNIENGASGNWNGVCVMFGGVLTNCLIHDNGSAILFAQDVNHCTIYNIDSPYYEYDSAYHENGFYMDGGNWTSSHFAGVNIYCRNSVFHDCGGGANMAYPNVEHYNCYVYNCLFYGVMSGGQQAINIDTYSANWISSGSVYGSDGTFTLNGLTPGIQYSWTKGPGDTACAGLTASGTFTASSSSQTLTGVSGGGVTANIDTVIQQSCYIYNNTIVLYGSSWPSGILPAARPYLMLNNLFITNNQFIGSSASLPTSGAAANVVNCRCGNNIAHTPEQAAAYGYTLANLYAPTSASSPTVGAGSCTLMGLFGNDIKNKQRPGAGWDIGAYQYNYVSGGPGAWNADLRVIANQ